MQVALERPASLERRLDDARARSAQLLDPRPQLGLQPLVVQREHGAGGGGPHELGPRLQLRRVDDRRDPLPLVLDERRGPSRGAPGQRDRQPVLVDEHRALGEPVRDREALVADSLGQRLADGGGRRDGRGEQPRHRGAEGHLGGVEHRDRDDRSREREHPQHGADRRSQCHGPR